MNPKPTTRREFLRAAALGALGAALLAKSSPAQAAGARPNIIFCMSDDQGWGDVAYNGHPILQTPALDAMARNGLRFDRFIVATHDLVPLDETLVLSSEPVAFALEVPAGTLAGLGVGPGDAILIP